MKIQIEPKNKVKLAQFFFITRVNSLLITYARMKKWIWYWQRPTDSINCNLFTCEALKSSWRNRWNVSLRSRSNWNLEELVFEESIRSIRRKTSRSKGENKQQTQPTNGVDFGIWTQTTLVGAESSHHCATLALLACVVELPIPFSTNDWIQ